MWRLSHRADPVARAIADRHYSRQKPGTSQFVPPGRCLVLVAPGAYWVTSWPFAEYVKHAWAGAWICSAFRRENGEARASDLIREAVAATRWRYGEPPSLGMVTFVDETKVRPIMVRGVPVYGWTFRKAGFVEAGRTKADNLLALQLRPEGMPAAAPPRGATFRMFASALMMLTVLAACPAPPRQRLPRQGEAPVCAACTASSGETTPGPTLAGQLDAIDARVHKLVAVRDACAELVRRTDYAARQRPGYERRRAQRGVLRAHVAARQAIDESEGFVCR